MKEGSSEKPKLAVTPFNKENPYQKNLADGLREMDWEVHNYNYLKEVTNLGISKFTILHIHWPPQTKASLSHALRILLFLYRLSKVRKTNTKLVWTIHNLSPHESNFPRIDTAIARYIARNSDLLICHSTDAVRQASKLYKQPVSKFQYIPHGNYIDSYPNNITRADAKTRLAIPKGDCTILFLGQIRPYKGVLELIDAFRAANQPMTRLIIAGKCGGGVTNENIQNASSNNNNISLYLKHIPNNDIQVFMQASDIVVFPYKDTLTSGAILLAMSFGKAILTYDNKSINSVIAKDGSIQISKDAPGALTKAIAKLPNQKIELKQMGENNFEKAQEYNWRNISAQTDAAYRKLMK